MVTSGGCVGWLKQRTNLEKTLLSLSCILILTLTLLILIGMSVHNPDSQTGPAENPGCSTRECIITAGQMLSLMDEKADPCTDLYEFACGKYGGKPGQTSSVAEAAVDSVYLDIKELLESSSSIAVTNFDSARSLYKECMEFDGLHRERKESAFLLLELMDRFGVGNWPVVSTVYEDSELTISDRLAGLTLLGVPVAFSAEVVPDTTKKGAFMLKIGPGGPLEVGRPAIDIRKDQELRTYMTSSLLLLGAPTSLRADTAVEDILAVDAYYATVQQDSGGLCDTVDTLAPEDSLDQLNNMIPEMNWTRLFLRIQKEAGLQRDLRLQRPFAVEVQCKGKIRDYLVYLNDVTIRTSHNYLGWRFFESFSKQILPTFGRPRSHSVPRWKECVLLLEKHAGPVLGVALTQPSYMTEGTEEKGKSVSRHTRDAAEKLLQKSHWLSTEQKRRISKQVKDGGDVLSHAPNNTSNSSPFFNLPAAHSTNYTAAVIGLRKAGVTQRLKWLDPETRSERPTFPGEMYLTSESSNSNSIVYFDKIREPYLRTHGSEWLNYGGYGVFTASRQTEELLPDGPGVPSAEEPTSLWDLWSRNRTTSACFRSLATRHFRSSMLRMDSKKTLLKDLFLDAGALEIALQGAVSSAGPVSLLPGMEHLSNEQMFYVAYAQTLCEEKHSEKGAAHIPVRNRVNTLVGNSEGFDKAFACTSPLVPDKCRIWS